MPDYRRPLQLLDGGDLDQQALAPGPLELHLGDRLRRLAGDAHHATLAEVGVADAVAGSQREVAVVADRVGDRVRPLALLAVRGGRQRGAVAEALAALGGVERARTGAAT